MPQVELILLIYILLYRLLYRNIIFFKIVISLALLS